MRPGGYFCIFMTKCIVMKNIFSLTITGVLLLAVSLFFSDVKRSYTTETRLYLHTGLS